jgi:DNA polymerase-3 subunit alpha
MLSNGITNIDSVTNYQEYINHAASLDMKAIAFSEHGSVFEWLKKKEATEKAGMKYIHAEEFYITETLEDKIRDNYHCVLIAKNYDGVKELNKLSSIAFNRNDNHFYYAPRISFDELINTSNNIIICTACLASILASDNGLLKEKFISFLMDNKHRCFLEIQHHNVEAQIEYNKILYKLSQSTEIPLIAGTDTHALNKEHLEARAILQRAKDIYFDNEEGWDLSFKTYDELIDAYSIQNAIPLDIVKEAIDNTNKLADMVEEFSIDRSYKYPHLWENPERLLRDKIIQGIKDKGVDKYPNYEEYLDRIEYEMEAYKHNKAIDFMLLMEDVISWCKSQDIQTGYGRGSVNGSIIAWLLGITEMDSIKFGLNFERFMNVERVSLSDIDTDIPPNRIDEVKAYVFNHHGLYCSDIVTFNTIADKGAIRDICRALYGNKEKEVNEQRNGEYLKISEKLCSAVDNDEEYKKVREQYPEVFKYVDLVKGCVVSVGNHPCGMIVSPTPINDAMGLFTTSTDQFPISQLYMKEVDSMNYVKLDLLKLDTIQLINDTCRLAGIPMILPDNLDIYDDNVWDSIRDDTTSIFQWESNTGQDYIKKLLSNSTISKFKDAGLEIDKMTLLSIGNSAIRPAGASYRNDLANGVVRTTGSKPIDDFLSNTFGYLVFQCQIIDFLHQYCGFTMGEADIVRRGFAKKTGTDQFIPVIKNGGYLNDNKSHYINGYIKTMEDKYGIAKEKSEQDIISFIQVIEDASSYLFSLNHSQPYSFMGYACGYLRYYYPTEFITSCLNINKDNNDKTAAVTKYAKSVGINIVPIKFGHSRADYSCDASNKLIYKGVGSVKYLNSNVAEELYELSKTNTYNSFIDLLQDISDNTTLNSKQLNILIRLDYFSEFGEINELLFLSDLFSNYYDKGKYKSKIKASKSNFNHEHIMKYTEEYKPAIVKEVNLDAMRSKLPPNRVQEFDDLIEQSTRHKKDGTPNGINYEKFFKISNVPEDIKQQYATKISEAEYINVDMYRLLTKLEYKGMPRRIKDIIKDQQEFLSYVDYVNPEANPRQIVVTGLNATYSPTFKAYCIKNGDICEMKVHKSRAPKDKTVITAYNNKPFEEGDVLYMKKCQKKPKYRKDGIKPDGKPNFVEVPGEYVWWINDYDIIQ